MTKLVETPFAGLIDGRQAKTGPHVLVSGPSGVGKSRRVLGPGILLWQGPVVAISSKPDLIELCLPTKAARKGAEGRTFVIDLSGDVPDEMIGSATRAIVDPTALIHSMTDALEMATVLIQAGTAGSGSGDNDAFWSTLSTPPLAAILQAAGQDGIAWAVDAVGLVEPPEDAPDTTPSWLTAVERLSDAGETVLARKLTAVAQLDEKQRSSVLISMDTALSPWLHGAVRGRGDAVVFTPDMLSTRASSLFMVAPADGLAAGAAVAVVDFISKRWRKNQTEAKKLPRVLFAVDELCNTLPWKKLPVVVTESRAMGINLLVAVQATSQFSRRFGHDVMEELRVVFPTVLLLTGAAEDDMLESAAKWLGKDLTNSASIDHNSRQSLSSQKVERIDASQLRPRSVAEGRLLRGKRPDDDSPEINPAGVPVDLVDISQTGLLTS